MAGSAPAEGFYVRGRLRGGKVVEGRPRPNGEGSYPDKFVVVLDVGEDTARVEYRDEDTARKAVEAANNGPASSGDVVTLPVGVRVAAKGGAEAYAFWYGLTGEPRESEPLTW